MANTQIRLTAGHPSELARSPGFPKLEELSVAAVDEISDVTLDRILKKSEKLTLLDVRNCRGLSVSGLIKIPAWDLTELFLSGCAAVTNPDIELVFKKVSGTYIIQQLSCSGRPLEWQSKDEPLTM